jgi:hypothetical protein
MVTDGEPWLGKTGGAAFDKTGQLVGMVLRNIEGGGRELPMLLRVEAIHELLSKIGS